jgi:hypothetical protein
LSAYNLSTFEVINIKDKETEYVGEFQGISEQIFFVVTPLPLAATSTNTTITNTPKWTRYYQEFPQLLVP